MQLRLLTECFGWHNRQRLGHSLMNNGLFLLIVLKSGAFIENLIIVMQS